MAGKSQSNICYMQPRIFYAASHARNPGFQVFRFSDFQGAVDFAGYASVQTRSSGWVRGEVFIG